MSRPRLLLVNPHPVWPPTHGWSVRVWNLARRLAKTFELHAFVFTGGTDDPAQREALAPFFATVHFQHFDAKAERGEIPGLPRAAVPFVRDDVRERIRALVSAHAIDVVLVEGTHLVGLLTGGAGGVGAPVAVTAHDLGFETERARRRARFGQDDARVEPALGESEIRRLRGYEIEGLSRARQIHLMSEANARLLGKAAPWLRPRLRVVPNGVDTRAFAPPSEGPRREGVLLLGSFPHPPNTDAVRYFLRDLWPRVRRAAPDAAVTLAGASPPDWIHALDGTVGISVAGEVPDVRPLLWRHAVLAAPIRAGSGTRIKILEAAGAGLPVVSTTLGAAGLELVDGEEIVLADSPDRFADAVVALLCDPERGRRLAEAARARVAERFDWDAIARRAAEALLELVPSSRSEPSRSSSGAPASSPASTAAVDLLIPWQAGREASPDLLPAIARLDLDLSLRSRVVARTAPPPSLAETCRVHGVEWSVVDTRGESAGELVDAALRDSPASYAVVLDPTHVPDFPMWLGEALWALRQPHPAAAVSGDVLAPGEEPLPRAVVKGRRADTSLSNLALRRETWTDFPFGAVEDRARFARQLEEAHQLLFESPDAPVRADERPRREGSVPYSFPPRASVVLCTRNGGAAIGPTLAALAEQKASFTWETIVVDNGSSPAARRELEAAVAATGNEARIVDEPTVGLSAARNRGWLVARGEIVVYLDDDAVPAPGWLEALVAAFEHPLVDCAGGPVEPEWEGDPPAWLDDRFLPYLTVWDRGDEPHDLVYNETPRGANFAVRRSAFERVGGFSRHLGRRGRSLRSCEETELCLRLQHRSRRIVYVPGARVRHRTPTARLTPEWMEARFEEQGLSEAIVDWMHFGGRGLLDRWRHRRARERAAERSGGRDELARRCGAAAVRGYRRGALLAVLAIPRHVSAENLSPED